MKWLFATGGITVLGLTIGGYYLYQKNKALKASLEKERIERELKEESYRLGKLKVALAFGGFASFAILYIKITRLIGL